MKTSDIIKAAGMVGGSFKLTALLQKRAVELMHGAPPLVDKFDRRDIIGIALQEVLEGKIELTPEVDDDEPGETLTLD